MCRNCGICVEKCPAKALSIVEGKVVWDEKKCCACDTCIKVCVHNASPRIMWMTAEEVWKRVDKNLPFIRGITVSGGECSLQADFVKELFTIARQHGLNTLMDSNGSYDFEKDPELMKVCDGVMLDVKADNQERHQWLTGQNIDMVLKNLEYLARINKLEEVRTVCIPEALESKKTIDTVSEILKPYLPKQDIRYKLIRYRHFGVREEYRDFKEPDDAYMNELRKYAVSKGFRNIVIL